MFSLGNQGLGNNPRLRHSDVAQRSPNNFERKHAGPQKRSRNLQTSKHLSQNTAHITIDLRLETYQLSMKAGYLNEVMHGLRKQLTKLPTATDILELVELSHGRPLVTVSDAGDYPLASRMSG